jgi:hypothetical protein
MTAARQERKMRYANGIPAAVLACLAVLAASAGPAAGGAATTEQVVVNRHTGLAIDGFDPVSYFADGAPLPGRPEFELRSGGVTWRFRNEGNRSAFAAAPQVYAPQFGGYDPISVGRGGSAPGHPSLWLLAGERLYLFYSDEARAAFAADPQTAIEAAERSWPLVKRALVRD